MSTCICHVSDPLSVKFSDMFLCVCCWLLVVTEYFTTDCFAVAADMDVDGDMISGCQWMRMFTRALHVNLRLGHGT